MLHTHVNFVRGTAKHSTETVQCIILNGVNDKISDYCAEISLLVTNYPYLCRFEEENGIVCLKGETL